MKLRVKIAGIRVHDVGYRVFLLRKALELGAEKFNAYNTKENGTQILFASLEADEDQISAFGDFVRENQPDNAKVSDITFEEFEGHVINISDYMHLVQVEQLSKGIPAILSIDRKQDKMLEKQDKMLEKQDKMLEKQDKMLEKQDETRKEIVGEIRELRGDLKSYLDEKLIRIESDIALIKEKIGLKT
jgi:acylphosphatase